MDNNNRKNYIRHLLKVLYDDEPAAQEDRKALTLLAKLEGSREYDLQKQYGRILRSISAHARRQKSAKSRRPLQYIAAAAVVGVIATIFWWILNPVDQLSGNRGNQVLLSSRECLLTPCSSESVGRTILLLLSDGRAWSLKESDAPIRLERVRREIGPSSYGQSATLKVPKTSIASFVLEDGTVTTLNAQSSMSLTLSSAFNRQVMLHEGEAYFSVANASGTPFVVELKDASIQVLGTEFNVNSYSDQTIATLVEGSVQLNNKRTKETAHLVPGDQAVVQADCTKLSKVDVSNVASWRDGKYVLKSEPLEIILEQISRWYDVEFEIHDSSIRDLHLTGVIYKSYSLEFVIKLLEEAGGVRTAIDKEGKIHIYKKP